MAKGERNGRLSLAKGSETQKRGAKGERRAALYLRLHGYKILERNWLFHHKEVDIIARKGDTIAFVEVKSLKNTGGLRASLQVDAEKRRNLAAAARAYIPRMGYHNVVIRFDIIEVDLSKKWPLSGIVHLVNAFAVRW